MLTLFTTPVIYLAIDRLAANFRARPAAPRMRAAPPSERPRMNISAPFIERPVATTLLTIAIALAGALGYFSLPVSPLPQVDFPTVLVQAQLPGASPDVVATSLAAPLERHLGEIADVTEMTSQSQTGQARIILQFGLDRDINGAAEDVQAAINAAQADLPTNLLSRPTYRKVNPADAPVLILSLTSRTLTRGQMYDAATNVLQQELSQLDGVGQVIIGGAALPAVRVDIDPQQLSHYGIGLEDVRSALANANANARRAPSTSAPSAGRSTPTTSQPRRRLRDLVVAYRNGDALRLSDVADVRIPCRTSATSASPTASRRCSSSSSGSPARTSSRQSRHARRHAQAQGVDAGANRHRLRLRPLHDDPLLARARPSGRCHRHEAGGRGGVCLPAQRPRRADPGRRRAGVDRRHVRRDVSARLSLDNLSLMALTIATGFVVDDAIVVLENISRHMEHGMPRRRRPCTARATSASPWSRSPCR